MIGIYLIKNTLDNKVYVGSSSNIESRLKDHKRKLNKGNHVSTHLQNAYKKYGSENFTFFPLEETTINNIFEKEQYWCDFYKANNRKFGYNIRKIVNSNRGNKVTVSEEARKKISLAHKGKKPKNLDSIRYITKRPILVYINNILIQEYDSIADAAKTLNMNAGSIWSLLNRPIRKSRKYPTHSFKYKNARIIQTKFNKNSIGNYHKNILVLDTNTGLEIKYKNAEEVSKVYGVPVFSVRNLCRKYTNYLRFFPHLKMNYALHL